MAEIRLSPTRLPALAPLLFLLSGCSLQPLDAPATARLHFSFAGDHPQSMSALSQAPSLLEETLGLAAVPPASVSAFNCILINVVGNGIPNASPHAGDPSDSSIVSSLISGSSLCTYPGVTSVPVSASSNIQVSLSVPTGPARVIQVLGAEDSSGLYCNSGLNIGEFDRAYPNASIGVYNLGQTVTDVFSSKAVTIANAYNSAANKAARKADCPSNSNSGSSFSASTVATLSYWVKGTGLTGVSTATQVPAAHPWTDSSIGGFTPSATQSGPSAMAYPTYYATGAGTTGQPYLQFSGPTTSGSGNSFTKSAFTFTPVAATGMTLFFVARTVSGAGNVFGISNGSTFGGADDYMMLRMTAGLNMEVEIGRGGTAYTTAAIASSGSVWYLWVAKWTNTTGTSNLSLERVAGTTVTVNATTTPLTFNTMGTEYLFTGFYGSPGMSSSLEVAEAMIYTSYLSAGDQATVVNYLRTKYGI